MYTKSVIEQINVLVRGFYFELYGTASGANENGFVFGGNNIVPFSEFTKIENAQILLEQEVIVAENFEGNNCAGKLGTITGLTIGIEARWLCKINFHRDQHIEFNEWFVPITTLGATKKLHILEI